MLVQPLRALAVKRKSRIPPVRRRKPCARLSSTARLSIRRGRARPPATCLESPPPAIASRAVPAGFDNAAVEGWLREGCKFVPFHLLPVSAFLEMQKVSVKGN
jgi:hypothetical protein